VLSSLEFAQIIGDFAAGPIDRADEFTADGAAGIDDERLRLTGGPVETGAGRRGVAHREQINVVAHQELLVSLLVHVGADGDDLNPRCHLLLHGNEGRHLFYAGAAPAGPEIQDNDVSAIVMQRNGMIGIGDSEIRRSTADQARLRPAIAPGKAQNRSQQE
jgi:hypothetical protein